MIATSKYKRLINLLDEAELLLAQYTGGYSNNFLSAEEFHIEFKSTIQELKNGNLNRLVSLYFWFSPTCDWDDFVGVEGEKLANEILPIVSSIRSENNI